LKSQASGRKAADPSAPPRIPKLTIAARQRAVAYDHPRLVQLVQAALPLCLEVARRRSGPLPAFERIECTVVSSRMMARVHRDHLQIAGPTDVITFPYGEILVCAAIAQARGAEFGHDTTTELALYLIHGLLHLSGHDDLEPVAAAAMAREQTRITKAAIRALPKVSCPQVPPTKGQPASPVCLPDGLVGE